MNRSDNLPPVLLAVGTYTMSMPHVDGKGEGIHLLQMNPENGHLKEVGVAKGFVNPSYLTVSDDRRRLYAVREVGEALGPGMTTFALDLKNFTLTELHDLPTPGGWPCHVSIGGAEPVALLSNYASGEVLSYRLDDNGVPQGEPVVLKREGSGPVLDRQEAPHSHCAVVSPDMRHIYLADLGTDRIVRHAWRDGQVDPEPDLVVQAVPGAGPRHLQFTLSGGYLLANHELASTVRMFKIEGDALQLVSEVSSLPENWDGVSGAGGMRMHPSGRFVYVGNRGHDSIFAARIDEAAGKLESVGTYALAGRTPRDIALSPDGRYLLAASQDDAFIRVFTIDQQTGALSDTGYHYPIHSAVCLQFI